MAKQYFVFDVEQVKILNVKNVKDNHLKMTNSQARIAYNKNSDIFSVTAKSEIEMMIKSVDPCNYNCSDAQGITWNCQYHEKKYFDGGRK